MPSSLELKRTQSARRRDQRKKLVRDLLGFKCVMCNTETELEIDHIDPNSKLLNVSALWTASEKKFLDEVAKCQVLCVDCHRKKTAAEQGYRTKPLYKMCERCGNEFSLPVRMSKTRLAKRRFCGRDCWKQSTKERDRSESRTHV